MEFSKNFQVVFFHGNQLIEKHRVGAVLVDSSLDPVSRLVLQIGVRSEASVRQSQMHASRCQTQCVSSLIDLQRFCERQCA